MFPHYCVFLREFVINALLIYINMAMQSWIIQFKISHIFKIIRI